MENRFEQRRLSFQSDAELYARYRPSYPAQIIQEIKGYVADISKETQVLELGCGTGQLTQLLLAEPWQVIATDPSEDMLQEAKKALPQGDFQYASLESFKKSDTFDIVVTATAYHWFDKHTRIKNLNQLLKPNGKLVVMVNGYNKEQDTQPIRKALDTAFSDMRKRFSMPNDNGIFMAEYDSIWEELKMSPLFCNPIRKEFGFSVKYNTEDFIGMQSTHSATKILPDEAKEFLFQEMRTVFDTFGGEITVPYNVSLFMLTKANA
jgi:SAM-dependent methyltransferase